MDVLDTRKKYFLSSLALASLTLGILSFSRGEYPIFNQPSQFTQKSQAQEIPPIPVVLYAPGILVDKNMSTLRDLVKDLWVSWSIQSPSLVTVTLEEEPQEYSAYHLQRFARREGADYIFYYSILLIEGERVLQPYIYSARDHVVLKSKSSYLNDYSMSENIYSGLESLFSLTERNMRSIHGQGYTLDRGLFYRERFLPSNDTLQRYLEYRSREISGASVTLAEWEDLVKREALFWLPWEDMLRKKYSGKEDSYETRYYLDAISKKSPEYFLIYLARLSLEYSENILGNSEKYKVLPMLELTNTLFQRSKRTFTIDYARYLIAMGTYYVSDKRWEEARLSLLNARLILWSLNQERSPLFLRNQFLLSRVFRESDQIDMAIRELDSSLGLSITESNSNPQDYAELVELSYYNLGCMNLEMGRPEIAIRYFKDTESLLRKKSRFYSDLMFRTRLNRVAALIRMKEWNSAISIATNLTKDIRILGLEGSEFDSKNSFNTALAYLGKGAEETSREYKSYYEKIVPYSSKRTLTPESSPERYTELYEPVPEREWIFSEKEEKLISGFTGKYRMENHADDIRSRTYTDRLEDHDIFLGELFGRLPVSSPQMAKLKKKFRLESGYKTGKNVLFVDIGPAIANQINPAVTSRSLIRNFPDMITVLLDLPSEVNIFMKTTDPALREELLSHPNVRILSGDGVLPLKDYFRKEGAWVLRDRSIPQTKNRMLVIRSANAIDVYEPFARVKPFLERLVRDFESEDMILFFNRLIVAKPAGSQRFFVVGSQSIRGFYHNHYSLDRKGQPPFILSDLVLGED